MHMLAFLVYAVRDITFLQWCMFTRMKQPIVKGFLYLILYYAAAGIVAAVLSSASESQGRLLLDLLTPFLVFSREGVGFRIMPGLYVGMGLQAVVIFLLLRAISGRLARPVTAVAAA